VLVLALRRNNISFQVRPAVRSLASKGKFAIARTRSPGRRGDRSPEATGVGAEVNLFVDHSQIVQLECLGSGISGTKSLWGRVVTYLTVKRVTKDQRLGNSTLFNNVTF
jgi:hypothetical protein